MITFFVAVLAFEGLKRGKISVVDVVMEVELPLTILLGIFFFSESLSWIQISLMFMIFVGVVLIATKPGKRGGFMEKGVLLVAAAAMGMALMNFMTAAGARQASPILAIWFPWVVYTAISLVYIGAKKDFGNLRRNAGKFKWLILGMGIFDTLAWLFFAVALLENELSIPLQSRKAIL